MDNLEEKLNDVSNWQIVKTMGRDMANAGKSAGKYAVISAVDRILDE